MHGGTLPLIYLAGHLLAGDGLLALLRPLPGPVHLVWVYGILFVFFYLAIMLWQTYYAIATCRTAPWGTRPATAGMAAARWRGTCVGERGRRSAGALDFARRRARDAAPAASILPVLFLGPRLVRAPENARGKRLGRRCSGWSENNETDRGRHGRCGARIGNPPPSALAAGEPARRSAFRQGVRCDRAHPPRARPRGDGAAAVRRRRRPFSLGLLVTVALVALAGGSGAAAVSLRRRRARGARSAALQRPEAAALGPCSGRARRLRLTRLAGNQGAARLAGEGAEGRAPWPIAYCVPGRRSGRPSQTSMVAGGHTRRAHDLRRPGSLRQGAAVRAQRCERSCGCRAPGQVQKLRVSRTATGAHRVAGRQPRRRPDRRLPGRARRGGRRARRAPRFTLLFSSVAATA